MRIFPRIVFILSVILIVLFTFLFLQFDPNQYQTQVQEYLQKSFGGKARIGTLSFAWDVFPGLKIDHLEILDPKTDRLLLGVQNLYLQIDLASFFMKRKIFIPSTRIDSAEIFMIRTPDGRWLGELGSRSLDPGTFFWPNILVQKAVFHLLDESVSPAFAVNLYQMNIEIHQAQFETSLSISIDAAFSPQSAPNLGVRATYSPERDFISFQLSYERGKVFFQGGIQWVQGTPYLDGKLQIHQLDLAQVIPDTWKSREHLVGMLSAEVVGKAGIMDFRTLQQTLTLKGVADLRRGAVKNINIVRDILHKIVTTSEGIQGLLSTLPPEWLPLLESGDTSFDILQCNFELREGRFTSDEIRLRNLDYLMEIKGAYGFLDREANFAGRLVLLKNFSDYMIQKIKGLSGLQNQQGRMVIPFTYQGVFPDAGVQPTIPYATSHFQS